MTHPLEGIKILDFSEQGFVPSGAAALADFGADVIKIERPDGDGMRTIVGSGIVPTKDGYDFLFELVNRNKRGVCIDVETEAGREVFERLVAWADVYITNHLPRVRRKLRTEPDDLFAINPKLVYARGHGQGQRGDGAEAGGYDAVSYWARGGIAHVLTAEDAPRPVRQRPALGDVPSGMYLAGGVCAGLVQTLRTGKGIIVDVSLLGAAAWTIGPDLAYASLTGEQMTVPPEEALTPFMRSYRTADERWVSLMMIDEARYWEQACQSLGLEDLVEQYPDAESRRAAWQVIADRISDVVGALELSALSERLRAHSCIFSVFSTPQDVLADPAVVENGYVMTHPDNDEVRLAAAPVQFDNALPQVRRPGPSKGADTREVLSELGYDETQIKQLLADTSVHG